MRSLLSLGAALVVVAATSTASAQDLAGWLQARAEGRIPRHTAAEQMDQDKDTEAPSLAKGTSLVDQTDAPDLISLGMSLYDAANVTSEQAPLTLTLSGWALRNAFTRQNPLDPAVYRQGGNWRRWSVTIGRERDEDTGIAARVFGAKLLAWNQRDISAGANRDHITKLNERLKSASAVIAAVVAQAQDFVYLTLRARVEGGSEALSKLTFINTHLAPATLDTTLALPTEEELAQIDAMLPPLAEVDSQLTAVVESMVKAIRGAPQLAFTYQARLRSEPASALASAADAADEHRFAAAFDYGPLTRT